MTFSLFDYIAMFFANFFVVCLLGFQSKNVVEGKILAAVITSAGISTGQFLFTHYASRGGLDVFLVCAAGGCAGIAFSIIAYKRLERFFDRDGSEMVSLGTGATIELKKGRET